LARWQLDVLGGQNDSHARREVSKALLLPSICKGESNPAKCSHVSDQLPWFTIISDIRKVVFVLN
jgi:hypothetical protein